MSDTRPVVAVVVGGESAEYEISLVSGSQVIAGLDDSLWNAFLLRIDQDGAWCFPDGADVNANAPRLVLGDGVNELMGRAPAVVFPVMHGPYGEDGKFQALMELLHLNFVGSSSEASSLAMNKARARDVFTVAGLHVPSAQELHHGDTLQISAPCVVKPMHMGSSVGLSVCQTNDQLIDALNQAFAHDHVVLVESFIKGREVTVGVLENAEGVPSALPVIEIRPLTSEFFDYDAKYTPGATDEICPAPISNALKDHVQAAALLAHESLGCRGMSRTDLIIDDNDTAWILETNTIPGMTPTSLLPQAAAHAGISFPEMLNTMLNRALG